MAMTEVITEKAEGNAILTEIAEDIHAAHEMAAFFLDIANSLIAGNFTKPGAMALDGLLFEQVNRLERVSKKISEFQHREQDKPRQLVKFIYPEVSVSK